MVLVWIGCSLFMMLVQSWYGFLMVLEWFWYYVGMLLVQCRYVFGIVLVKCWYSVGTVLGLFCMDGVVCFWYGVA